MDHLKNITAAAGLQILTSGDDPSGLLTPSELRQLLAGQFVVNYPKFSFYRAPVTNTRPTKEITLPQLFAAITGHYYKKLTEQYRAMEPGAQKTAFKTSRFDHVTFAGVFSSRKTENLKVLSGYAVFDFDHIQEVETLKTLLIADENLDAQMCFTSPSADGVKLILFNEDSAPYDVFYAGVTSYIKTTYPTFAASLDSKTKDLSRTCFVCHDETAFIKPEYSRLWQASKS